MKPDWDKLMDDFKDSSTALVGDVDCTAGGESLCGEHGVQGYPTIKYGDPADLQDYNGGRTYDDFKAFADENLGPSCGPANLDLCSEDKKALIDKYMKMPLADLEASVNEKTTAMEKAETDFKELLEGLQKKYEEQSKKKDDDIKKIKDSGLATLKSVHAHLAKQKTEL
eukprot:TRINITY_DN72_c0_g4_i1.p2 TRINITY_DN72_c0_g4~~TRINITY_DN72_c0_g4_i1.p2  ORF type:complete len:169 (-),score=79.86 TRINITY_DN72_c0_g4_i1:402-908(-)